MTAELMIVPVVDKGLGNSAYLVDLGDQRMRCDDPEARAVDELQQRVVAHQSRGRCFVVPGDPTVAAQRIDIVAKTRLHDSLLNDLNTNLNFLQNDMRLDGCPTCDAFPMGSSLCYIPAC